MTDRDSKKGGAVHDELAPYGQPHGDALPTHLSSDDDNGVQKDNTYSQLNDSVLQQQDDQDDHQDKKKMRNNTNEDDEDTYIHPVSQKLFDAFPPIRMMPVLGDSLEVFHPRFVFSLGITRLLSKGIANGFVSSSMQGMFLNHYQVAANRYQRLSSLFSLGWAVNSFVGILADTFALMGYTKRWYLVFSAIAGCAFTFVYALLPGKPSNGDVAGAFLFLHALCNCNIDTLTQAFYSRSIRQFPKHGPALVSWACWTTLLGSLISGLIQGPLTDLGKPYVGPCVAAGLLFIIGVAFIFNPYGEKKNFEIRTQDAIKEAEELQAAQDRLLAKAARDREAARDHLYLIEPLHDGENALDDDLLAAANVSSTTNDSQKKFRIEPVMPVYETCMCGLFDFNRAIIRDNWKLAVMCAILTACVIVQTCVSILGTKWQLVWACIGVTAGFIIGCFIFLPFVIAKASVFTYFSNVLYIMLPGALNTYYVATPACLPDGPHFSYTFYTTMNSALCNVTSMVGIALFNAFLIRHRFPLVICMTTILQVIGSLVDLIIVMRWNIYIGIPDHAMYLCGYTIVFEVVYMLARMPLMLLMSRVCPRGTESIIFTFLSGVAHIGMSTSSTIGAILMETRFPVVSRPPAKCDFSNVKWLVIIGHLCCPLLIIPLAFGLLPSARINENMDLHGKVIKPEKKQKQHKRRLDNPVGNVTPNHDAEEADVEKGYAQPPATAVACFSDEHREQNSDRNSNNNNDKENDNNKNTDSKKD